MARLGRTLYRSLRRAVQRVEHETLRCGATSAREVEHLRRAAGNALPRDLRGLLDIRGPGSLQLTSFVRSAARRLIDASSVPPLAGVDLDAAFAALKHVNARIDAMRRLVRHTASSNRAGGVTVHASSEYAGFERARFQFRYQVRIANDGPAAVTLLRRAWSVADLDGRERHVQGPGVVGHFPTIPPGGSFEYESSCPLQTPLGTQRGKFMFHVASPPTSDAASKASALHVDVAPFSYRTPSLDGADADCGHPLQDEQPFAPPRSRKRGRKRGRGRRRGEKKQAPRGK